MNFKQAFQSFAYIGDSIECEVDGYTVTASIAYDDTPDALDERQEGFCASLDKDAPGFIGPGHIIPLQKRLHIFE